MHPAETLRKDKWLVQWSKRRLKSRGKLTPSTISRQWREISLGWFRTGQRTAQKKEKKPKTSSSFAATLEKAPYSIRLLTNSPCRDEARSKAKLQVKSEKIIYNRQLSEGLREPS